MIDLTAAADARVPYIVARRLASQGLAVFPVQSRQPLTARGVYSATSNLTILSQMRWRNADGCGLATGKVSGIDVLDVDIRARTPGDRESPPHLYGRDGFAALADLPALPPTLCAQTPRNGRHFYFHHVVGGRNRKLSADGSVEWFSSGKLVVVPPAPGRTWLNRAEIAEAPDWLKALVTAPKPIHTHNEDHGGGFSGPLVHKADLQGQVTSADLSAREVPRDIYFLIVRGMGRASLKQQRRVRGLWANLASKSQRRNDGLNYTAWQFSQFIGAGDLNREIAAKLLWLACEANGYLEKDGADVVKEVINRVLQPEERSK
jgi:Bifunctional DNA primase/polymerase, N-terminal